MINVFIFFLEKNGQIVQNIRNLCWSRKLNLKKNQKIDFDRSTSTEKAKKFSIIIKWNPSNKNGSIIDGVDMLLH